MKGFLKNRETAIVIPIFKQIPDAHEQISINRCCIMLGNYPVVFILPEDLDANWYETFCSGRVTFFLERFDGRFFSGLGGYNQLLLSAEFYERLLRYEYILVHQLDVFIFRNVLPQWCSFGYDFIAAPWINTTWHAQALREILAKILLSESKLGRQIVKLKYWLAGPPGFSVGNGGLSLRRVSKFLKIAVNCRKVIDQWEYSEDLFWAIYVPLRYRFKVPSVQKALLFSFDSKPELSHQMTNGVLPFGAHAWYREDHPYEGNLFFWEKIIKKEIERIR